MSDLDRRQDNGRSLIFEKLTPDERRAVDVAIIERIPPTFSALWMEHKLGEKGVSYSAFYRYARRIRNSANLAEIADLSTDDGLDLETPIRRLLARRAVDALVTEDELPPRELATLLSALRQSALQEQKNADQSRLAWARLEHDREFLQLKLEHLQTLRQRLLGHSAESPESSVSSECALETESALETSQAGLPS